LISKSRKNDGRPDERQQLNERQLTCLRIIDEIDRQNEKQMTQEWNEAEQGQLPPESMWRWIQYDPSHTNSDPELKWRLRLVGIGGGGIKATMKALWMRAHLVDARLDPHPQRAAWPLPGAVGAVDGRGSEAGAAARQ
jgi:hypothetical protein